MPGKLEKGGLLSMGESGQGLSLLTIKLMHIYCGASSDGSEMHLY